MTSETERPPETEFGLFIDQILDTATEIANRNFGKVSGVTKAEDNNQVLTDTDLEIGIEVIKLIQAKYPTHNIIDEEAGVIDMSGEYTWVIDPVDGTSNYAEGSPLFGFIVGLLHHDEVVAGGVALPAFHEKIIAERGKGAYLNGQRLKVTTEQNLKNVLVGYSLDGHQENPQITYDECALLADIVLNIRNLRTSGSVFDAMMVAKGKYGAYHHRNTKIWDVVGMQIVIEEAGGTFTQFNGEPINYASHLQRAKEKFPFCTGAPVLHSQLQTIIHKHI